MISIGWNNVDGQIGALIQAYRELPRHIAKKHLKAAMRRTLKDGVPVLKSVTPKGKTRRVRDAVKRDDRGRFLTGSGKKRNQRGGALRRSVRTKAQYIGRNVDGVAFGTVGYKAGEESLKALRLEFGTKRGIEPRRMMQQFRARYHSPAARLLAAELRKAIAAATRELNSGKNPGWKGKGG